jgi:hypothetical protein
VKSQPEIMKEAQWPIIIEKKNKRKSMAKAAWRK